MAIYVICPDYGSEGLGAPICATFGKDDANSLLAVMTKCSHGPTLKMIEVPTYPIDFPEKKK